MFSESSACGGAEEVMAQMLEGLDRRRWRPVVFTYDEPALAPLLHRLGAAGVVHRTVPRLGLDPRRRDVVTVARALRAERASVFHAHLTWPLACKFGIYAAWLARIRVRVATAHTRYPVYPDQATQPKYIARALHRYLAVSRGVARQLSEEFGIPLRKIQIVPNGVAPIARDAAASARVRATLLGSDAGRPMVLTVARLELRKGHVDLMAAATQVPDVMLVFAGDGPDRSILESRARELGVSERVRFLGQRSDVHDLLGAADLFVLPSLTEGLPLSVLEAMSIGTPIVSTAIEGVMDLITDGETGRLVPAENPDALAAAIKAVVANRAGAHDMAVRAMQRARTEFSLERMVERVEAAYETIRSA
jgi:glycosyltransferase involved in cell wall biosynthesis